MISSSQYSASSQRQERRCASRSKPVSSAGQSLKSSPRWLAVIRCQRAREAKPAGFPMLREELFGLGSGRPAGIGETARVVSLLGFAQRSQRVGGYGRGEKVAPPAIAVTLVEKRGEALQR